MTRRIPAVVLAVVVAAVSLAVPGCGAAGSGPLRVAQTKSAPANASSAQGGNRLARAGSFGGASATNDGGTLVNDPSAGMALADAESKAATGLIVPTSAVLGDAVRALPDADNGGQVPRRLVGMGVLFKSGALLRAEPTGNPELKLSDVSPPTQGVDSYTDGRTSPFDTVTVGGRQYLVQRGGVQVVSDVNKTTNDVRPAVGFVQNGTRYTLSSPSGCSLDANQLLSVAQTMW